ncbi:hypothetical protein SODALDRAFT_381887 [Sodiomyces alkalinus F11]|uniref:Uncharacterized protein n=1 Tax=Sodiomyces alkalinus (strain CBS 110278 / VKM F-3762 / F11) TaxID=1314773 RepID=A0A3N2PKI8_SODAK|nr:hypothetical protein SODALDRAFT_381887 [Sodiomyces alkalinus F11]ROT34914.1 hypothetical protein SODALDRAFT_381887 [Sodiomyces alkalinus F11]
MVTAREDNMGYLMIIDILSYSGSSHQSDLGNFHSYDLCTWPLPCTKHGKGLRMFRSSPDIDIDHVEAKIPRGKKTGVTIAGRSYSARRLKLHLVHHSFNHLTDTGFWTAVQNGSHCANVHQTMEKAQGEKESSWLGTLMDYATLSSGHATILRYISGFFILLGCVFVLPVVFLILLDIVLWVGRTFWNSVVCLGGYPEQQVATEQEVSNPDFYPELAVDDVDASAAVHIPDDSQAVRRRQIRAKGDSNHPPALS